MASDGTYEWFISGDLGLSTLTGNWRINGDTLHLVDNVDPGCNMNFIVKKRKLYLIRYGGQPWMNRKKIDQCA